MDIGIVSGTTGIDNVVQNLQPISEDPFKDYRKDKEMNPIYTEYAPERISEARISPEGVEQKASLGELP